MAGNKENSAPSTMSRFDEFEGNVKGLGEDLKALEEDLSVERKKNVALEKEIAKLEKYRSLQPENKEFKKKITALEKDLKKLEKIKGLQDEHKELKQNYSALEKDLKKLEKIKGLEDEHKELRNKYTALEKDFKKSKHSEIEYKELEKKYRALEKELKKLTAEHEDFKPKFVGAKTALDSIQREKNELKVEAMNLTTRLAATDAEKDELKAQNAELMIVNENTQRDAAKYKHENICKWKEEQAFKAKIVELENAAKQYSGIAAENAEMKQGIMERGETIQMNMDRIAGLEKILQDRERAITALQAGQDAMANKEIRRTLQIHRLTEQIAVDQNHNKYLYEKLATEMKAYHANVYHLRMGHRTEVPFPKSGGGYPCPPSDQYGRSYDIDVDRSGRTYMAQEESERRQILEERVRREAEERYRGETDAGLHSRGQLGRTVIGSFQLGMSGEQIGRAGVEAYYSQDPDVTGPFGYQGQRGDAGVQAGPSGYQTGERFLASAPLIFEDEAMPDLDATNGEFYGQEDGPGQ